MSDHEELQFPMDCFQDFEQLTPPLSPVTIEADIPPLSELYEIEDQEEDKEEEDLELIQDDDYVWASSAVLRELRRAYYNIQNYHPECDPDQASLSRLLSEILGVTGRARRCLDILTDQIVHTNNQLIQNIILDEKSRVLCWYQKLLDTQMVSGLCRYSSRMRNGDAVWPPSYCDIFTQ